ncbi:MAG: (2Fe-2S)-binding protein [Phycisphaerae bacterium]|nr:(2Fe-2S)-binding protein [Phycisphaerae bacterium]
MLKMVTITVDGATIRVPEGTSVLDAALEAGICIPNLCHMPGVTPIGACRVCIVEVVKDGRAKMTASCTLDAKEGMVVRAHSDAVLRARRNIVELLLAEAPNSRAIQDLAARVGVTKSRYPMRNNDCVLCGRCVRVCDEVWQSKSLGFVGRGINRRVALPFNTRPESCKHCNSCIDVCPMTITPCPGPMKVPDVCGLCASQTSMADKFPDTCVWCELGRGFQCARWQVKGLLAKA